MSQFALKYLDFYLRKQAGQLTVKWVGQYEVKYSLDSDLEAKIIATNCSEPPEGFTRWSLRILVGRMVELDYEDELSHETVRQV